MTENRFPYFLMIFMNYSVTPEFSNAQLVFVYAKSLISMPIVSVLVA